MNFLSIILFICKIRIRWNNFRSLLIEIEIPDSGISGTVGKQWGVRLRVDKVKVCILIGSILVLPLPMWETGGVISGDTKWPERRCLDIGMYGEIPKMQRSCYHLSIQQWRLPADTSLTLSLSSQCFRTLCLFRIDTAKDNQDFEGSL